MDEEEMEEAIDPMQMCSALGGLAYRLEAVIEELKGIQGFIPAFCEGEMRALRILKVRAEMKSIEYEEDDFKRRRAISLTKLAEESQRLGLY
jgi:hypothetical protein